MAYDSTNASRVTIANRRLHKERAPSFDALLGGEVLCHSATPIYGAARALLERGHDPAELMTARHQARPHDSIKPTPVGELANWTVEEGNKGGLALRKWRPDRFQKAPSAVAARPQARVEPSGAPGEPGRRQRLSSPAAPAANAGPA